MTTDERVALAARHQEARGQSYGARQGYCQGCGQPWPCDATQALDALDVERASEARLREALAEKGTIYESVLLQALGAIVDADHPGSEDGRGKWRCRCKAHRDALDALAAKMEEQR